MMRMKRTILLMLAFTMLVALLTSCGMETQENPETLEEVDTESSAEMQEPVEEPEDEPAEVTVAIDTERVAATLKLTKDEMKLGAFIADNTPNLSEIPLTEYDYSDLKEYFDTNPDADTSINAVNERFPIECLRCREVALDNTKSVYRFYTVYKVAEGGYYYVFWEVDSNDNSESDTKKAVYTGYMSSVSEDEEFKEAANISGSSKEIRDQVRNLDPSVEVEVILDDRYEVNVYRLLKNEKILNVHYTQSYDDPNTYYHMSSMVYPRFEFDGCLTYIFTSDLPINEEEKNLEKELLIAETSEIALTKDDMQFAQFTADNSVPLSEYDLLEYELSDLYDFFGRYDPDLEMILQGKGSFLHNDTYPSRTSNWFPLQCTRCVKVVNSDNTSMLRYYTVYKVKEGGYFYVFWSYINNDYRLSYYGYIPHLNSVKDFDSIKEGKSSIADVYLIDPALDFRFKATSSGAYSLSLLDSGEILWIDYKYDRFENMQSLIVTDMTVMEEDEVSCSLTQIFKADLPRD